MDIVDINNIPITTDNLYDKEYRRTIYRKEIANMFKIVRFPSKLKIFLLFFRKSVQLT
jgi:hypothetical protein